MKDTIKFNEVCVFPNNIADVTSISLECNYECCDNVLTGDFIVEGTYRAYELSINQDNFSYKIPFEYHFNENIDDDSALVNINDFTYDFEDKELKLDIEYDVSGNIVELRDDDFINQDDFDRFILENDVDVIDFSNELEEVEEENICEVEDIEIKDNTLETDNIDTTIENNIEVREDTIIENEIEIQNNDIEIENNNNVEISNTIINNIRTSEDEYITYHIYVCNESDTFESISTKFKISIDMLKSYNSVDNITAGVKLIIPDVNE